MLTLEQIDKNMANETNIKKDGMTYGRNRRGIKEPLDEGERGE